VTPKQRLFRAFSGQTVNQIPYFPKIWIDLAAALTGINLCDIIEDPELAMKVVIDAAILVNADGARQFLFPARRTEAEGDTVYEIDENGRRLGTIDMAGGLATQLIDDAYFRIDDPAFIAHYRNWKTKSPLVQSINDAQRIAVPTKDFYKLAGYGLMQRKMIAYAGERVSLVGDLDSPTLSYYIAFRGMENGLIDLFDQPELVQAVLEKGTACSIERGKFNIDVGHRILRLNDSMANMSLISPEQWKQFVYPHFKTVCDELHRYNPECRIYCHICGNVLPIVDLLVEAGLDAIAPLDPLGGFTISQVRERIGDDMVLMGGINTLSFIQSSPEQIQAEARACIEQGDVNHSRFILGSGCVVPRGTNQEILRSVAAVTAFDEQRTLAL
jgi:uroporphyrinogen-III decarboxylase